MQQKSLKKLIVEYVIVNNLQEFYEMIKSVILRPLIHIYRKE